MRLSSIISKERTVKLPPGAPLSKADASERLISAVFESQDGKGLPFSKEQALAAVLEREAELPTGVGHGFAFPHARLEGLRFGPIAALAVAPEGVDFGAADGVPAKFILLCVVPSSSPNFILRTRSALIGMLSNPAFQAEILAANDADAIWRLVDGHGAKAEQDVLAKDIMRKPLATGNVSMTLRDAVLTMSKAKADILPVLDDEGRFIGDVTIKELLSHGIPEFFFNLKTVSFVRHMDPFEKYFSIDRTLKLGDLKTLRDVSTLPPDATIMEVVFELTVRGRKMVHVVDDGKLVGVIDRSFLIDKILLTA